MQQLLTPHEKALYPDGVAFREAITSPTALNIPTLTGATLATDRRGLPLAWSGRFAVVFRLQKDKTRYAVRCFTTPNSTLNGYGRAEKLAQIHARLNQSQIADLFVPFAYHERGIRIGTQYYPVQVMPWASGVPLGKWLEENIHNANSLRRLAGTLSDALTRLEAAGIAHGDWQHDNILVSDNGAKITFVDYDGVFIPEFAGQSAPELGHQNYQHPHRTSVHFGVGLDRFAAQTLTIALRALAYNPELWARYGGEEAMLFRRADFINPQDSSLFAEIASLAELYNDTELVADIATLKAMCHEELTLVSVPSNIAETPLLPLQTSTIFSKASKERQSHINVEQEVEKAWAEFQKSRKAYLYFLLYSVLNAIAMLCLFLTSVFFQITNPDKFRHPRHETDFYILTFYGLIIFWILILSLVNKSNDLDFLKIDDKSLKTKEKVEKISEAIKIKNKKINLAYEYPDVRDFVAYRLSKVLVVNSGSRMLGYIYDRGTLYGSMLDFSKKLYNLRLPDDVVKDWESKLRQMETEFILEHQQLIAECPRRVADLARMQEEIEALETEHARLVALKSKLPIASWKTFLYAVITGKMPKH
jgi:hypothetical protein